MILSSVAWLVTPAAPRWQLLSNEEYRGASREVIACGDELNQNNPQPWPWAYLVLCFLVLSREWMGMGEWDDYWYLLIVDCGSFPHSLLSTSKYVAMENDHNQDYQRWLKIEFSNDPNDLLGESQPSSQPQEIPGDSKQLQFEFTLMI
jgi:hypothetical protein